MKDQNSQEGSENGTDERPMFVTRLGIEEDKFVRTVKEGNYTPTIHEIDNLLIEGKIGLNDARILYYVKSKTINFRNTEVRHKRKDFEDRLQLKKYRVAQSLKFLIEQKYLIEMPDKDGYYFYGLNPVTFDGLICLKTIDEGLFRLNRSLKSVTFLAGYQKKKTSTGHNLLPLWTQKVTSWVTNCVPKEEVTIRKYSGIEMLKYTLIKYILINGLSAQRGDSILEVTKEIKNPEYAIKQLVALIHKHPESSRAITEEMLRAKRENSDAITRKPIYPNALIYVVTKWDVVRTAYHNFPEQKLDMSENAVTMRNELAALIAEYPIEMNKAPATITNLNVRRAT